MKRQSKEMRELKDDLRYWQTRVRLDCQSCRSARDKVKAIASKMRVLQRKGKQ